MYAIDDWQLEPLMQPQNYAERGIQTVKTHTNRILDHTGAPPSLWLQYLLYVCFLLNYTADVTHNYQTSMWSLTGTMSDIFSCSSLTSLGVLPTLLTTNFPQRALRPPVGGLVQLLMLAMPLPTKS